MILPSTSTVRLAQRASATARKVAEAPKVRRPTPTSTTQLTLRQRTTAAAVVVAADPSSSSAWSGNPRTPTAVAAAVAAAATVATLGVTGTAVLRESSPAAAEGASGSTPESGGGAWGRRGLSQGKYHHLKKGDASHGEEVQGEDDKFFDPDYEYLMVRLPVVI